MAQALRLEAPLDHALANELDRFGVRRIQEQHRSGRARVEALLTHATQQIAHRHRDIAEVDVDRAGRFALVADGAVVGDIAEFVPVPNRHTATSLLFVEECFDEQRGREDLIARAVEQIRAWYVRRANGFALAATQTVFDGA